MAISVRTRFEVFKRDEFTCRYCGRKSPDVVLEADHIVPVCNGGSDDPINLTTACWDCNRGKSGKALSEVMTGEDPHDKAILILERERQLEEYNRVLAGDRRRREAMAWDLIRYWKTELGHVLSDEEPMKIGRQDWNWLYSTLTWCPSEQVRNFMDVALSRGRSSDFKYVAGCCKNWREQRIQAAELANA